MKFKTSKQNLRPFQGLNLWLSNLRLFQVFKTPRVPCPTQGREGSGAVCIFIICLQQIYCFIFPCCAFDKLETLGVWMRARHGWSHLAKSSMSGLKKRSFTEMCLGWHQLLFMSTMSSPPFYLLLTVVSLSAWTAWKPGMVLLESGM